MQVNFLDKCIKLSRVIIIFLVFIILNVWFLYENDPHWILSIFISVIIFFITYPSSKICKFLINKGDKIESKILKLLYYIFTLPIAFLLCFFIVGMFYTLIVILLLYTDSLNLGLGLLIAYTGIGIFNYALVPYFQTLIILALRYFLKFHDNLK